MAKSSEKKGKKIASSEKVSSDVAERLKTASENLVYVSEVDAPFTVVQDSGDGTMIAEIKKESEVDEVGFAKFFERLTRDRDWFGERENLRAKRFLDLQKLIEESLTDLKVYRIGRIRIRILIVGRTEDGGHVGLETNAIET